MRSLIKETTEDTLIEYLSELTIDEFETLLRYCGKYLFTCMDNPAINLHLERIYDYRGIWRVEFTDSSFNIETYTYKISELTTEDQQEIINTIQEII
jgi:hypothetical protein